MNLKVRQYHQIKKDVLNSAKALFKGREMVFKAFESEIFLKAEELKDFLADAIKTASKRAIQKTAQETGDLRFNWQ